MGLFPVRSRFRPVGLRLSVRLHSQHDLAGRLRHAPARATNALKDGAVAATNDARIVAVVLVLAAAALAWEMAVSFKV